MSLAEVNGLGGQRVLSDKMDPGPSVVFVGGIPSLMQTTDELVVFLNETFGPVESFKLVVDASTNKHKGYGFVKFVSLETAEVARRARSIEFKGKMMNLGSAYSGGGRPTQVGQACPPAWVTRRRTACRSKAWGATRPNRRHTRRLPLEALRVCAGTICATRAGRGSSARSSTHVPVVVVASLPTQGPRERPRAQGTRIRTTTLKCITTNNSSSNTNHSSNTSNKGWSLVAASRASPLEQRGTALGGRRVVAVATRLESSKI